MDKHEAALQSAHCKSEQFFKQLLSWAKINPLWGFISIVLTKHTLHPSTTPNQGDGAEFQKTFQLYWPLNYRHWNVRFTTPDAGFISPPNAVNTSINNVLFEHVKILTQKVFSADNLPPSCSSIAFPVVGPASFTSAAEQTITCFLCLAHAGGWGKAAFSSIPADSSIYILHFS